MRAKVVCHVCVMTDQYRSAMLDLANLTASRRSLMGVLARASSIRLAACFEALVDIPACEDLRTPQTGLVMLRGRIAGSGAPFNLGEASVTRAAVRLSSGETGHSYILGRDAQKARKAAIIDAMFQCEAWRPRIEALVLQPLRQEQMAQDAKTETETAKTRVDFFTLVRGDP